MKYNIIYTLHRRILLILVFICSNIIGQTHEIGVFLGGSLFHGDVGYNHAEYAILDSKPVFGFKFKRNFNYHFGLNLSINRGEIYGNDASSSDLFALQRNLHFKCRF